LDEALAPASTVDHDHLSLGLVRLHDAVRLADFLEAEDPHRLDIEATSRGVRRDLLQRHI
jgi:hypothetical protein